MWYYVIVFGVGKNLLIKSILGLCGWLDDRERVSWAVGYIEQIRRGGWMSNLHWEA